MYKHQAIDGLLELRKITDEDVYCDAIENCIYDLRTAMHFSIGHEEFLSLSEKYDGYDLFEGETAQEINLPYDCCVFWGSRFEDDGSRTTDLRFGILVRRLTEDENVFYVRFIFRHYIPYRGYTWILWHLGVVINVNREASIHTVKDAYMKDGLDNPYGPLDFDEYFARFLPVYLTNPMHFKSMAFEQGFNSIREYLIDIFNGRQREMLTILNTCLMVLNCQNITYESVQPPEKLNKKRRKKGKEEMVSYHLLNVNPLSHKKQTRSGEKGTGDKKRVHLCRGHFKTFTEDAPLFGRFTGRFWWQPQVRGQDKSGIVHKDYNVEV